MDRKYVAFISYRHAPLDSAVAKMLHTFIEQYNIPKALRNGSKKLGTVFRDKEELPASSNLSGDICRALDNSEHLIVICSKDTAASPWVTREVEYFLSHHDRSKVFTVLVSGEPQEVFPPALTHIKNPDGTVTDVEPLAVDIRSNSISGTRKHLRREITRLYAAIIGCPYDALIMREQRRKRKRTAAILSAIFAIIFAFSVLLLAKNRQIDSKNAELENANMELENANLELENANTELAKQKAEVQLRESQLLTESANDALNNGDYISAIKNSIEALPSNSNDRPYYAPAEQTLINALGIFDISGADFKVISTNIRQMTPVSAIAVANDGSMIATIDEYNVVSCFDASSSKQLWTYQLATSDNVKNMQFFTLNDGSLIAFSADNIVSFDFETGEILWSHKTESFSIGHLSPDGSLIACLSQKLDDTFTYYEYDYTFISTQTGELLHSVHIGDSKLFANDSSDLPNLFFTEINDLSSKNGDFSSDGKYFIGNYYESRSNNSYTLHYYMIDIEAETVDIIYSENINSYYTSFKVNQIAFCDNDSAFVAIRTDPNADIAAVVSKYDIVEKQLLWHASTPDDDEYYSSTAVMHPLMTQSVIFIARANFLYLFEVSTGELIDSVVMESDIVSVEPVGDHFFSVICADGRYTLGWINPFGVFFADNEYAAFFDLGEVKSAQLYNEGFQRLSIDDSTIKSLDIGDAQDNFGYVVLIPNDNPQTVAVKRITFFEDLITPESIDIFDSGDSLSGSYIRRISKDAIAIGQISNWNEGESQYRYTIINLNDNSIANNILLSEFKVDDNIYILPDGSGYIENAVHGDISYTSAATGEKTVFAKNETVLMLEAGDYSFTSGKYMNATTQLQPSGDILSVQCSDEELTFWRNGTESTTVTLPNNVKWSIELQTAYSRELFLDDTGHVLLSHYNNDGDNMIDAFAIYDIYSKKWHSIPLDNFDMSNAYCQMADKASILLLVDSSNTVYLFDIETGKSIGEFPLQLPQNSIAHAKFIQNDEYLLVKTTDLRILIYDLDSGEIVYSQQISGYANDEFQVFEDSENNRLYFTEVSSVSDNGICIDTTSWTKLADIPGLIYYNSDTNVVYCYLLNKDTFTKQIISFEVPTTAELVEAGTMIVSK